ncbi:MmgE/PrpD family protein [Thermodesulfobacteriota bacterium]
MIVTCRYHLAKGGRLLSAPIASTTKILNLNHEETIRALGIAGSGAGGLRRNNGTMTKPLHAGNAARNGVLAAIISQKGFVGTQEVFEGVFGFCQCFCGSEGYDLKSMTEKLGKTYEFLTPKIGPKRYPACMSNHRSLDAIFNLIEHHKLDPETVVKVECGVSKNVMDHLFYLRPQKGMEGKFSLQYCMAIALLDGKVGLEQFSDKKLNDPRVHEFIEKISVYEHPELKGQPLGKKEFSEVTVHLKDGQTFSNRVGLARGRPSNPLEYDEIVSKYRECARRILSNADIEKLLEMVEHLEDFDDISELTDIMRYNTAS